MTKQQALEEMKSLIAYLQDVANIQRNSGQILGALGAAQAKINLDRAVSIYQHLRDSK